MPYSFTHIERRKTRIIQAVFGCLILWYFILSCLICWIFINGWGFAFFSSDIPVRGLSWGQFFNVFLISSLIALVHWFLSVYGCVDKALKLLDARPADMADDYHRRLKNIVDEVSIAAGVKPFEVVICPLPAMNAFSLEDFSGRRVIGVTEGLLARLNRAQLEAVVAQQAAYLVSGDGLAATITSSLAELYGGLCVRGLRDLLDSDPDDPRIFLQIFARFMSIPAVFLLFLLLLFSHCLGFLLRIFLSRQRHLRADAVAVRLSRDPLSLAEALYGMSYHWRGSGLPDAEMEAIFILDPHHRPLEYPEPLADLFSTHPSVEERLKVLTDMAVTDIRAIAERLKMQSFKGVESEDPQRLRMAVPLIVNAARQPQRSSADGLRWMCPRCYEPLQTQEYEGVDVHVCPLCLGVLVAKDNVGKIIYRREKSFPDSIRRAAQTIKEATRNAAPELSPGERMSLVCPACGLKHVRMLRRFYTLAYFVEIDVCFSCEHHWFDRDELEILQCLIEEKNPDARP